MTATPKQLVLLRRIGRGRVAVMAHNEYTWRPRGGLTVRQRVYITEVDADEKPVGKTINRATVERCETSGWIEVVDGWLRLTDAGRALVERGGR